MHFSLQHFAAIAALAAGTTTAAAQGSKLIPSALVATQPVIAAQASPSTQTPAVRDGEGLSNPLADPRAIVRFAHARFTVLTPELIRMEWAADDKFEDHASLVFLNRHLPVPRYTHETADNNSKLTIATDALKITYAPQADGRFSTSNLSITLTVDGKPVTWHPGDIDPQNLQGHDAHPRRRARRQNQRAHRATDFVSRAGWALVDDSTRPLFDSADFSFQQGENSPWPWVMERPAGDRQDWYFFGYGHDYKQGPRRLRPRRRTHSAAAALRLRRVVVALLGLQRSGDRRNHPRLPREFHAARCLRHRHGLAHQPSSNSAGAGRERPVRPHTGLDRLHLEQTAVSLIPTQFLDAPACRRPEDQPQPASRVGRSAVGRSLSGDGQGHGHRSGDQEVCALRHHRQEIRHQLHEPRSTIRWRSRASISGGSTGSRSPTPRLPA